MASRERIEWYRVYEGARMLYKRIKRTEGAKTDRKGEEYRMRRKDRRESERRGRDVEMCGRRMLTVNSQEGRKHPLDLD